MGKPVERLERKGKQAMKHTIWIDLTDIEKWSGQHGGTQRVVYGIAEQYFLNRETQEVRFFVFDSKDHNFYEVDFYPIKARVETNKVSIKVGSLASVSKKQKLQHYAIEYTPRFIRSNDKLRRLLFKTAKISYIQANNLRKILPTRGKKYNRGKQVIFSEKDTLLILGKPWDEPEFMLKLAKLKILKKFKLVILIYDLVIPLYPHLHSPTLFEPYTKYMFETLQAADLVLPISKSTERDLLKFCEELSLTMPPSRVIRLGDEIAVSKTIKPEQIISKNFIICVGTIEVRKNHTLLYYVYKLAEERDINLPDLIIVGRLGWLAEDVYRLIKNDKKIAKKIKILENASDANLAWLYKNCLFSVYPSIYEGWGLPVAESLQYGKYCVASNSSSIPEIAGELLEYFSPYSADECLHQLIKYIDKSRRLSTESKIKMSYQTTRWLDVYNEVCQAINNI